MRRITIESKIRRRNRNKLMDKDWSEKNKEIQKLLSKEDTFGEAIDKLIEFRCSANSSGENCEWVVV